jgi:diguanylate cyclase (GGDEF)-like protein
MTSGDIFYFLARCGFSGFAALSAVATLRYSLETREDGRDWRISMAGAVLLGLAVPLSLFDAFENAFLDVNIPIPAASWLWLFGFDVLLPIWAFMLVRAWRARDTAERRLELLAVTDVLTKLLNRRGFQDQAHAAIAQARRGSIPVSVVMFDIDRFKSINDGFGHDAGDTVLRLFAAVLGTDLRAGDVLGRLGGEEFALLLPGNRPSDAIATAERLRDAVRERVAHPAADGRLVTVSAGVAHIPSGLAAAEALARALSAADEALYAAKQAGRDRAMIASEAEMA